MKILVMVLLIGLISAASWSAEKKSAPATAQKDAEVDICYAYYEYREADSIFRRETGGSYRPGTRGGQLAREAELKQARFNTLVERYHRNYRYWFNPQVNPQACLSK